MLRLLLFPGNALYRAGIDGLLTVTLTALVRVCYCCLIILHLENIGTKGYACLTAFAEIKINYRNFCHFSSSVMDMFLVPMHLRFFKIDPQ